MQSGKKGVNFSAGSAIYPSNWGRISATQMDISRLPVTPLLRPASAAIKTSRQPASAEAVERLQSRNARQASRESHARVVQGELLHRAQAAYQSTRAFIDERRLDQAQPAGWRDQSLSQARAAISRYVDNTRPEAAAESGRGRSVNFFV